VPRITGARGERANLRVGCPCLEQVLVAVRTSGRWVLSGSFSMLAVACIISATAGSRKPAMTRDPPTAERVPAAYPGPVPFALAAFPGQVSANNFLRLCNDPRVLLQEDLPIP
jgi:hypothetical protein